MDAEIRITVKENGDVVVDAKQCSIHDTIRAIEALMQVVPSLRDFGKKEVEE